MRRFAARSRGFCAHQPLRGVRRDLVVGRAGPTLLKLNLDGRKRISLCTRNAHDVL